MKKAVASEMILTIGVLVATGIAMLQLKEVFYSQQILAQEEVVVTFANDLESIMDKATAVTGNATFAYYPSIKKYRLTIEQNTVSIYDKISEKTASFAKTEVDLKPIIFEDSEVVYVIKVDSTVYIFGKCKEKGEKCLSSFVCCEENPYCWGQPNNFVCNDVCTPDDEFAADDQACCSGYLNTTTGKCDVPPVCPASRICPDALESTVIGGKDCCPGDKPVCSNKHCCPTDKPIWCEKPKTGNPRCVNDAEFKTEECEEICPPSISQCYNHWHWNHYDGTFFMNVQGYVCDYYEVCHPDIKWIINEIINCCKNKCAGSCHSMCNQALSDSGLSSTDTQETRKKCYGLYAIYGLDGAAKWMKGYQIHIEEPASIMLNSQTWMCTGYSIALTTLLRSIGYDKTEVYSLCGPGHAYNLVKLPGETKYRFADTVGNSLYISGITGSDWYRIQYGACRTNYVCGCQNDEGMVNCPSPSNIILGGSC